jgi:uncharacterized protein (DUF488 family)
MEIKAMHTLYTLGYTGLKPELIAQAAQAKHALVVDTRYRAQSRQPHWNKKALTLLLGQHYVHLPSLGNVNYKNGGEIVIADPDVGVPFVVQRLQKQPVVLLCVCADVDTCHRKVVAELVQAACGCDVQHIGADDLRVWVEQPPHQLPLI